MNKKRGRCLHPPRSAEGMVSQSELFPRRPGGVLTRYPGPHELRCPLGLLDVFCSRSFFSIDNFESDPLSLGESSESF